MIENILELKEEIRHAKLMDCTSKTFALSAINDFEAIIREELRIVEGCPITKDNEMALELNARLLHRLLDGSDVLNSSTVKQSNRSTQKQEEVVKVGGTKRRKGEVAR